MLPKFLLFYGEELTIDLAINNKFSIIYSLIIPSVLTILNFQLIISV